MTDTASLVEARERLNKFADECQFGNTPNHKLIGPSTREQCAFDLRLLIAALGQAQAKIANLTAEVERLAIYASDKATLANGATWKARAETAEAFAAWNTRARPTPEAERERIARIIRGWDLPPAGQRIGPGTRRAIDDALAKADAILNGEGEADV